MSKQQYVISIRISKCFFIVASCFFLMGCFIDSRLTSLGQASSESGTKPTDPYNPENPGIIDVIGTKIVSNMMMSTSGVSGGVPVDYKISPDRTILYRVAPFEKVYGGGYRISVVDADGANPHFLSVPIDLNIPEVEITSDNSKFVIKNLDPTSVVGTLYSVNADGSNFIKISKNFVAGGSIHSFKIAPDGQRVVYFADADIDGKNELYSVKLDGTGHVKLNTPLSGFGAIGATNWTISPDSSKVAYYGNHTTIVPHELFCVNIDGSGLAKMNSALVANGSVLSFIFSPNSQYIAYLADGVTDTKNELFVANITSATATKVNAALIAAGDVITDNWTFTSDSTRILYTADAAVDSVNEVFSVLVNGTGHVRLSEALAADRDANIMGLAPNGTVIYATDKTTNGVWELYSISADGTNRVLISSNVGTLVTTYQTLSGFLNFKFSSDGQYLIYASNPNNDAYYEVYRVRLDGTSNLQLSNVPAATTVFDVHVANNGKVFYSAGINTIKQDIYAVNIDGTGNLRILGLTTGGQSISGFMAVLSGNRIYFSLGKRAYTMNQDGSGVYEVFGNAPVLMDRKHFNLTPNGQKLVTMESETVFGYHNIYVSNRDGSGKIRVSPNTGEFIIGFYLAPDNLTIIVLVQSIGNEDVEIYRVGIDGTGWALASGSTKITSLESLKFSSVGGFVVYKATQDDPGMYELYSFKLDGTGHTKLNQSYFSGGDIRDYAISPTSASLIYLSEESTDDVVDLFSVNLDGTAGTQLSPPLVLQGSFLYGLDVTRDGNKILYIADQDTDNVVEAYAVNWDGTGNLKLSPVSVSGGNVSHVLASPNGQKAVIVGDLNTYGKVELYSANIMDGSQQIKISGPMVTGGNISNLTWDRQGIAITPDSKSVIFMADKDIDGQIELYSANLDGSMVHKLNGTLVANGNVNTFKISLDGTKIIYSADAIVDGIEELFSVNADGTGLTKLNRDIQAGDYVSSFDVTGNYVLHRLKRGSVIELYRCKTDGGNLQRLHSDLSPMQSVGEGFKFSADNLWTIFSINNEDYRKPSIYILSLP